MDAFGFNVSSRVQTGGAWTTRHSRVLYYIALLMQMLPALNGLFHGRSDRALQTARPTGRSKGPSRASYTTTLRMAIDAWWNSSSATRPQLDTLSE